VPIRCNDEQVQLTHFLFPCPIKNFSNQYLGIPLSMTKLLKVSLQSLENKMSNKLPA
jgi:hypothetical protein